MKAEGLDGAVLHSAADLLYVKNGYELAFGELVATLAWTPHVAHQVQSILDAEKSEKYVIFILSQDLTPAISADLHFIREYSVHYNRRHVKSVRNLHYFHQKLKQTLDQGAFLSILYEKNQPRAYCLCRKEGNHLTFFEQYSLTESKSDYLQLWAAFLDEFDGPIPQLQLKLYHEDHVLLALIQTFGGNVAWRFSTGNMIQFFNPLPLLQKMQTDFSLRVESSTLNDTSGSFLLSIDGIEILLAIHNGVVTVTDASASQFDNTPLCGKCEMTSRQLATLVLGFFPAIEILDESQFGNDKQCENLLAILFPELHPIWDYFDNY